MNLESQVVSLDLAKRLKELGVKRESYFCYGPWGESLCRRSDFSGHSGLVTFYPAFSVAEMGTMLPHNYSTWRRTNDNAEWWASDLATGQYGKHTATTEADARAKMLIYLIEKGLVKP